MTIINPTAELVSSPATDDLEELWVGPELAQLVNLAPCEDDARPLQHLFTLHYNMRDRDIADNIGGLANLIARRATIAQLMREVQFARMGQKGLFKKGRYYLLYLEGVDSLVTVGFWWRAGSCQWGILCCRFGQDGGWRAGDDVFGN